MRDRGKFVSRGNRFRPVSRIFDYPLLHWPWWEFAAGEYIYITVVAPSQTARAHRTAVAGCRVIPTRMTIVLARVRSTALQLRDRKLKELRDKPGLRGIRVNGTTYSRRFSQLNSTGVKSSLK